MGLSGKRTNTLSPQIQNFSLSMVILCCVKLLYIMYTSNTELLDNRQTLLHFISQNVYIQAPLPLHPNEDCLSKTTISEYRYRVASHIMEKCQTLFEGKKPPSGRLQMLPAVSLNSIALDKQRNFMFTAVVGAFANRWSKLMIKINEKDGGKDNLIKVATFFKTVEGRDYLENSRNLFKFYFVRNPLDRVISGYYYYFSDMKYAKQYLDGEALKELVAINNLNEKTLKDITFQQYIKWIVYGPSANRHFGVQYDIIQPCIIDYTLDGIFEILSMQRLIVANHVLDLKTQKSEFTTERNLTFLTEEAKRMLKGVDPETMADFYSKYSTDYTTWNYSKPDDWWYPYPELIKNMRRPNPNMLKNDFPKVRNLREDEMVQELDGSSNPKRQASMSIHFQTSFMAEALIVFNLLSQYQLLI